MYPCNTCFTIFICSQSRNYMMAVGQLFSCKIFSVLLARLKTSICAFFSRLFHDRVIWIFAIKFHQPGNVTLHSRRDTAVVMCTLFIRSSSNPNRLHFLCGFYHFCLFFLYPWNPGWNGNYRRLFGISCGTNLSLKVFLLFSNKSPVAFWITVLAAAILHYLHNWCQS